MDHYHIYRKLAENNAVKYTTIRTLDIGGDKFASKIEVAKGDKPGHGATGNPSLHQGDRPLQGPAPRHLAGKRSWTAEDPLSR